MKAPAKGKGAKTAKPVKRQATANGKRTSATPKGNGKPPAKRTGEPKVKQPKGMVVEILKLASRKDGVSPAELNKLTEWKGAPWKWLFSNPKGNGYCDRWGYKFKVIAEKDDPRAVQVPRGQTLTSHSNATLRTRLPRRVFLCALCRLLFLGRLESGGMIGARGKLRRRAFHQRRVEGHGWLNDIRQR